MSLDESRPNGGEPPFPRAPDADPTLVALVPRRSPVRNAALGAAGVLVLVGAWLSPNLRPDADGSSGSWAALPRDQVLTITAVDVAGWPDVAVRSVADAPGAEVAGAWVFPGAPSGWAPGAAPALEQVRAAFPDHDLERAALPTSATDGASLVILWVITDCDALIEGQRPVVALRTALGLITSVELGDVAGPAFDLATLVDAGTCPRQRS